MQCVLTCIEAELVKQTQRSRVCRKDNTLITVLAKTFILVFPKILTLSYDSCKEALRKIDYGEHLDMMMTR